MERYPFNMVFFGVKMVITSTTLKVQTLVVFVKVADSMMAQGVV